MFIINAIKDIYLLQLINQCILKGNLILNLFEIGCLDLIYLKEDVVI